jgi:predicted DNA-binding protein
LREIVPTRLHRINLSIEPNLAEDLELLAKTTHKTVAGLAKELIIDALDRNEDLYLSKLANELDVEGAKTISHEEFWG